MLRITMTYSSVYLTTIEYEEGVTVLRIDRDTDYTMCFCHQAV